MDTDKFLNAREIRVYNEIDGITLTFDDLSFEEKMRFTKRSKRKYMTFPKVKDDETRRIENYQRPKEVYPKKKNKQREYSDNFPKNSSLRIERGPNKGMIVLPEGVKMEFHPNVLPHPSDLLKCSDSEKRRYQEILRYNQELFDS